MPELGTYGSVRGAAGNSRPYRECRHDEAIHAVRRPRKAPRHEIAGSGAPVVPRALWRFNRAATMLAGKPHRLKSKASATSLPP